MANFFINSMLLKAKKITNELFNLSKRFDLQTNLYISNLLLNDRYQTPKALASFGYKVYSQNDEDGIIREIFNRIGTTNKYFIEIGVGDGLENNTLALLFDGWHGLWLEGSKSFCSKISRNFKQSINVKALSIEHVFATRQNINELISSLVTESEIDLLCIDIDGNDFYIFDAITAIKPRVIVMEYNAKFPPKITYCMAYKEDHVWQWDDSYGASLKFLETELAKRKYLLVGCNISGVNAFFVREDLVGDNFLQPYTAEMHYEPPRFFLAPFSSGHKPSYAVLENSQLIQGKNSNK